MEKEKKLRGLCLLKEREPLETTGCVSSSEGSKNMMNFRVNATLIVDQVDTEKVYH